MYPGLEWNLRTFSAQDDALSHTGQGNELLFNGHRISVWVDKKVVEMDNDVGCITF